MQVHHEKQVSENIESTAQHQKEQRSFAVSNGAQRGGVKVVDECEYHSEEDDPHVQHAERLYGVRRPDQNKDPGGTCYGQKREEDCKNHAGDHRCTDLSAEFVPIFGAVIISHQHGGTHTEAVDEQNGHRNDGIARADGGQGICAHKFPHNDGICRIVKELKKISENKRDCEV